MTKLPVIPASVPTGDNSGLSAHDRCPRLYEYAHRRHLHLRSGPSGALQFGSLLHEGLAAWYETVARGQPDMETALRAVQHYEDFHEIPEEYRTRGRALVTIAEYIEYWGDNTLWWGDDVIFTETPFTLEDDEGFRYGGKIDLVVEYNGRPWIVDHKSTSRGGNTWWEQFRISPQMIGYVWAASMLHGEPIAGVILNRLLIHKVKKPPHEQFARKPFFISEEMVAEWRRGRILQYHEIERQQEAGFFPMRTAHCSTKYGMCQFHQVCSTSSPKDREKLLAAAYEERVWDWMTM